MKKIALLLAALVACTVLHGQYRNDIAAPNFSVDITYSNYHVFRGLKESGETMQPCVEVPIGYGFAGLWANTPFASDAYYEIDAYAGAKGAIVGKLQAEAIVTLYHHPKARNGETRTTYEAGVGLTYPILGVNVSAKGYYDFKLEGETVEGSIAKNIPLQIRSFKGAIDIDAYIGARASRNWTPDNAAWRPGANPWQSDDRYYTRESYNYYGANLKASWQMTKNSKFHAGVHYADHDGIYWPDAKVRYSAGMTLAF